MNSLIRKSTTPFGKLVIAVFFLIIFAIISISGVTHASNSDSPQRGRLITIHDRGSEKVILSQAATIGEALKEAGITIDAKDAVEPAVSEKLVASDYQVNIYRARPVIVVDGNVRQKVMTPYQTAAQIASSIGLTLYPEDKTAISRVNNLTEGAGLQLTITRATPFSFTLYGKTTTARTQAKTIGDMLIEKNIKFSSDDRVSLDQTAVVTNGLAVRVWREGKQTITVDEPVNFEIEKIKDANQEIGYDEIKTVGENGSRNVIYEVTIQDGNEVGRVEIASLTTKEPIKQIEIIGTKVNLPTGSHTDWMAAAGIDQDDYGYVEFIITRESHWNPGAINATGCGGSGCYGLGQTNIKSLSASCPNWQSDPICQLRFFSRYAVSHGYGSWSAAENFWKNNGWW